MSGDVSVGDALSQLFSLVGEAIFKWVPGIGVAIASPGGIAPATVPTINHAVSAPEVVAYLQVASAPGAYQELFQAWATFTGLSIFLSLVFGAWLIYNVTRVWQIRRLEYQRLAEYQRSVVAQDVSRTHLRWQKIQEQTAGETEGNWRLAILEADIMLAELLDTQGYRGETMADKMRSVNRAQFNTIDSAWEAHRFRNRVAHESSEFTLTNREVRRIISLYERVFKEFNFV